MTALEMLEAQLAKWREVVMPLHPLYHTYNRCADELQPIIDKMREEQPIAHLDMILTMFRSVGGGGEHCYSRREIEEYVEALVELLHALARGNEPKPGLRRQLQDALFPDPWRSSSVDAILPIIEAHEQAAHALAKRVLRRYSDPQNVYETEELAKKVLGSPKEPER